MSIKANSSHLIHIKFRAKTSAPYQHPAPGVLLLEEVVDVDGGASEVEGAEDDPEEEVPQEGQLPQAPHPGHH